MRTGVLVSIIVVVAIVVVCGAWLGVAYGVTRVTGPVVSEERGVPAFTKVDVSGKGTLIISQGEAPGLTVEAPRSVLDQLDTSVHDGTLHIEPRSRWFYLGAFLGDEPITYHLTVTDLEAVELSGNIDVRGESTLAAEVFVLECSGSSDVSLEVQARELRVDTSGSSDITLAGAVDTVVFDGSGSTEILARSLASRIAQVNCSGSSAVEVNASERLDVNASGSSTVAHLGNPVLTTNISGSGEIRSLVQ